MKHAGWQRVPIRDAAYSPMLGRSKSFTRLGLHGHMVALNFVQNRLALLQARQQPAWRYAGSRDPIRLHQGRLSEDSMAKIIKDLLNVESVDPLPDSIWPLYNNNQC